MTTTANAISNEVGKAIQKLTPVEMAKYILANEKSIAEDAGRGKDVTARENEYQAIFDKYIVTLSWPDYAKFWQGMWKEDTRVHAEVFFTAVLDGLHRQNALVQMLLIWMNRELVHDLITYKEKPSPELSGRIDRHKEYSQGFHTRQAEITAEINEIVTAGFWDVWNIPRPVLVPPSHDVMGLLKDIEQDMVIFEKKGPAAALKRASRSTRVQPAQVSGTSTAGRKKAPKVAST